MTIDLSNRDDLAHGIVDKIVASWGLQLLQLELELVRLGLGDTKLQTSTQETKTQFSDLENF